MVHRLHGQRSRGRGQGLARAVKRIAHRYAFDAGARAVRTTNEERNERMRALNAVAGATSPSPVTCDSSAG